MSSAAGAVLEDVATVRWLGKQGLHLDEFNDFLYRCWLTEQANPDYIIIHVGSNDMGVLPKQTQVQLIKRILTVTRSLLPHTIMFWSAILPRVHYPRARRPNKVERARVAINRWVGRLMRFAPGGLIPHPQIVWDNKLLFARMVFILPRKVLYCSSETSTRHWPLLLTHISIPSHL